MAAESISEKSFSTTGKDRTCKSEEIATTPAREVKGTGVVTPGDQPISEREQQSSKKKHEEQKRTMDQYFGRGERVQPPSKGGPQSNRFFSDGSQRRRNAQQEQTTLSELSTLLTSSIM